MGKNWPSCKFLNCSKYTGCGYKSLKSVYSVYYIIFLLSQKKKMFLLFTTYFDLFDLIRCLFIFGDGFFFTSTCRFFRFLFLGLVISILLWPSKLSRSAFFWSVKSMFELLDFPIFESTLESIIVEELLPGHVGFGWAKAKSHKKCYFPSSTRTEL